MSLLVLLACLVVAVHGDVYMHMFRGSNNRLNEQGRERNNANRMFDSQNNNRGGYNVGTGQETYFIGSVMPIEWTNQHSCADNADNTKNNANCELVIQYMCADNLRDGTNTGTVSQNNGDNQRDRGMHEDTAYYKHCRKRSRNFGLFVADQLNANENDANRNAARNTRQNPKGKRSGHECPEERDYYPYWGPSPWRDIAILTNDDSRCALYKAESQNVIGKPYCKPANVDRVNNNNRIPITQAACTAAGHTWETTGLAAAHGIDAPVCEKAPASRDNHNGNGIGGFANTYNWTIPNHGEYITGTAGQTNRRCATRLRYNITTADYNGWTADKSNNNQNNDDTQTDLTAVVGAVDAAGNTDAAIAATLAGRGIVFKNNARNDNLQVEILPTAGTDAATAAQQDKFSLQLAINTAQLARTFQDRSHSFHVDPTPAGATTPIQNINVRGKRGNIVQVYPAVEYDFTPNRVQVPVGATVHIQWDGSNRNPNNNDGQGRRGTDRSNMVLLADATFVEGTPGAAVVAAEKKGQWGRSYPEPITRTTATGDKFLGLTNAQLSDLAGIPKGDELNSEKTYLDMGPITVTAAGTFVYMCSRNNNFSNRSQKGKIIVGTPSKGTATVEPIGQIGGNITLESGEVVSFKKAVLSERVRVRVEKWEEKACQRYLIKKEGKVHASGHCLVVFPIQKFITPGRVMNVRMKVPTQGRATISQIFHSVDYKIWTQVKNVKFVSGFATFDTHTGGVFVAQHEWNVAFVVGLAFGVAALLAIAVVFACVVRRKRKEQLL